MTDISLTVPEFVLGIPGEVFLIFVSAFFYVVAVALFWQQYQRSKDELMAAFLAFLAGMAAFHLALGVGSYYQNNSLVLLGLFAALTGSTFTLKFVLARFKEGVRGVLFYVMLGLVWVAFIAALFLVVPVSFVLTATLWYMIMTTGIIVGMYVVVRGFRSKERPVQIKCVGGGLGMITCCLVADITVLTSGVSVLGEALMSIAPIMIIASVYYGRQVEKRQTLEQGTRYVSL